MLSARLALVVIASSVASHEGAIGASPTMCSLVPLEQRLRLPGMVGLLGTAAADTVLAGAGGEQPVTEAGHSGPGRRRHIYGQRVRLERLQRDAASYLKAAIARDSSVVIVPWDFNASCDRVTWSRSARWLTPGTRATLVVELRDRRHWVGGRPTFDAMPAASVYQAPWAIRPERVDSATVMSAEEFLMLYEVLPDGESLQATPDSAAAPLLRWAQSFPHVAAKQPAAYLLDFVREQIIEARYLNRPSLLSGTYRVTYRTATGDSSVFFARTEEHPSFVIRPESGRRSSLDSRSGRPIIGHYLLALGAGSVGSFPVRRTGVGPEGYFALLDSATARTDSGAAFAGSIDLEHVAQFLASDSLTRRRLHEAARHKSTLQTRLFKKGQPLTPGRFLITPTGAARFEMLIENDGTPVLTVRAERISREHLQPQEP